MAIIAYGERGNAYHGTPLVNVPAIMLHGLHPKTDPQKPEWGPMIFAFLNSMEAAASYSPWIWVGQFGGFVKAVLNIQSNTLRPAHRGQRHKKQYRTDMATVKGVNFLFTRPENMVSGELFLDVSGNWEEDLKQLCERA